VDGMQMQMEESRAAGVVASNTHPIIWFSYRR